jgi:hypothetical protein
MNPPAEGVKAVREFLHDHEVSGRWAAVLSASSKSSFYVGNHGRWGVYYKLWPIHVRVALAWATNKGEGIVWSTVFTIRPVESVGFHKVRAGQPVGVSSVTSDVRSWSFSVVDQSYTWVNNI